MRELKFRAWDDVDKYRPVVTVLKVKKNIPTVIRVSGREYVLRAEGQFNQRKKGAVRR